MFSPVYLDWNATGLLHPQAREAMLPWLGERFGNASSRHEYGRQARAAIDDARAKVAEAVGAHPTEVVFVSGGSEANNLFLKGAAACLKPGLVVTSAIEHPCVREPARQLRRAGWTWREVAVDGNGTVEDDEWTTVLDERPKLVSIMLANNESGVVQDIADLAARARASDALFHTDAVQALGKLPIDFRALGVHAMTLSAHKIGGPLGVGALVLDKRVEVSPLIAGGGQERGLRSGTENVAAIVGFGAACDAAVRELATEPARLAGLRNTFERYLAETGARIFSVDAPRLANTCFFSVEGVDGETLVAKLDRAGFACASGSACSSAHPEPSPTLVAMGMDPALARNAVRVTLGRTTTEDDIARFITALGEMMRELRNLTAIAV